MSLTTILSIAVPALAAVLIIAALISLLKGLQARRRAASYAYGVGRQEARQSMLLAFIRAGILAVVGVILLVILGLTLRPQEVASEDVTPTVASPTAASTVDEEATATITPAPTETQPPPTITPMPSPTNPLAQPTGTVAPTATSQPSAVVNSEVGLYLRERPGGTQEVELLPNGTILILLPGRETVDDTEWQQVRAPSGLEGWVAVDFIVYR